MKQLFKDVTDQGESDIHSVRKSLRHEQIIELVDNEARKEISLTMDEAVCGLAGVKCRTESKRRSNAATEELEPDLFNRAGEHAERDERVRIVKPDAQRETACSHQLCNLAAERVSARFTDFVAEHPRVPGHDAAVLILLEDDLLWKMGSAHGLTKYQDRVRIARILLPQHSLKFRAIMTIFYFRTFFSGEQRLTMEFTPKLSCVIFDMDGTLTRTNELIFAGFNHIAQKYLGKKLSPREIIALFGPPEEGALAALLGEQHAPQAMEELCEYYRSHHGRMASLHPGVEEILRFLKDRRVKLAIFTGKSKRTTEITLREFEISDYFDLIISGTDVINHKPHPEGINRVLQTFHLRPSEALMVGDALSDVKASRSAGVKMAAVLWDSYDRERVAEARTDYLFHEVGELLNWFRTHLN